MFIQEFLKDRPFKVTVNWTESGSRHQEEGVPHGSILSVTLFAIKIKSRNSNFGKYTYVLVCS